jgi:F-type H+-transporting ATPase subunit a
MFATIALLAALSGAPQQAHDPAVEAAVPEAAQEHAPAGAHGAAGEEHAEGELDILHHIQDSQEIETPFGVLHLPERGSWMVGPVDMTPSKHVVFLALTAGLVLLLLLTAAGSAKRAGATGAPRKGHNAIEALVLFLRDQVVMPNVGHGGERYVPFVITLFFFILISNLFGLLPWGATATANISVTAALAIVSFIVVEVAGMRALGPKGYMGTIVFIPHGLPKALIPLMAVIMTPVELLGKLTKPFALAIRLFANMTAGHVVLLAIIGLIFVFGSYAIAVGPVVLAIAIFFLEIFVAFLQAYIFALLTSVFIGLIVHAH